jgi:glutamate/tyrosine decarboxylase-like PLP-dependent enzyme
MTLEQQLHTAVQSIRDWQHGYGGYQAHPSMEVTDQATRQALADLTERLRENYPTFHPRYAGQMIKPPHPSAVVAYLATMLINPNNHALDAGPATAAMEKEVVADLAAMFGLAAPSLGHLTSSGTIANLEALFVARELHPDRGIAYSDDSHYTHARMCHVLGMKSTAVRTETDGRIDLDALEQTLRTGQIGTIVLTAGTTGRGVVDPIDQALDLADRYGCRIHVDAAYGGFFTLLARDHPNSLLPRTAAAYNAISRCDSVVVDPHKHGLQPYGCGAVLFADPAVGRFYAHDSPYTYFTSKGLHLGEISLECSRAGASAAALWTTLRLLPLHGDGLGQVLLACRSAALAWTQAVHQSQSLRMLRPPELDIVTYLPEVQPFTVSNIDRASQQVLDQTDAQGLYLSVLKVPSAVLAGSTGALDDLAQPSRVLRSVLMKPEHDDHAERLVEEVAAASEQALKALAS